MRHPKATLAFAFAATLLATFAWTSPGARGGVERVLAKQEEVRLTLSNYDNRNRNRKLTKALNQSASEYLHNILRVSAVLQVDNASLTNKVRRSGGAMSTIAVSNVGQLSAALSVAKSGDTIILREGTYADINLRGVKFDGNVTITSADASKPAVIHDLEMRDCAGLTFKNLEIEVNSASSPMGAIGVFDSKNIHFDQMNVHGSLNGTPADDSDGVRIKDSQDVSFTNSEFQQLRIAIGHGDSSGLNISGNFIHDIRMDGIRGGGSSDVTLKNNYFKDFYQNAGDHADAIQFYPSKVNLVSTNIVVEGNVVEQGAGQEIQGIFMRANNGSLFDGVLIKNNLIVGGNFNGIFVEGSKGLQVLDNTVVSMANETTWIRVKVAEGAVVAGNSATKFLLDAASNITASKNDVNSTASDKGAAALQSWFSDHPTVIKALPTEAMKAFGDLSSRAPVEAAPMPPGAVVEALTSVTTAASHNLAVTSVDLTLTGSANVDGGGNAKANHIIGNAGDNRILGMAGDDVLEGGAGQDILDGGDGNDTASYEHAEAGVVVSLIRWNGEDVSGVFQNTYGAGKHKLISIENVTGSSYNDTLTGDWRNNVLEGSAGDDKLVGGVGADTLHGGSGADVFSYTGLEDSTVALGGRDVIKDFNSAEGDRIDLRRIDAIEGGGENAFKLVAAFTKVAGQLTITAEADHYVVQGDVNGDGVGDFAINVFSPKMLTAADFVL